MRFDSTMSKYKGRKLLKELRIEVKRLDRVIKQSVNSRSNNLELIEVIKSHLKP